MHDLHELFPDMQPHELDNMPNFEPDASPVNRDTYTPAPEACSNGMEDTPMPEVATAPPRPNTAVESTKKSKSRGRSLGENSSRPIKEMRRYAGKGDIEAAMKLGWGVDRITDIFNKNKAKRGEKVTPGQPIDDSDLLKRIADRQKYQAEIQKKRLNNLRARAEAGDFEAAKKLKLGKTRLRQLFPDMYGEEIKKTQAQEKIEESFRASTPPEEVERERTPAEPFDFEHERQQMTRHPSVRRPIPSMLHEDSSANYQIPGIIGRDYTDWSSAFAPSSLHMSVSMTPPRYPTTPMPTFDPKRALYCELEAAMHQVSMAQTNLAKIQYDLEQLEKVEAAHAAHPCVSIPKRQKIKIEAEPKSLHWNKKMKQARPSNFPAMEVTEETQEAGMEMSAPAPMPVHALLRY